MPGAKQQVNGFSQGLKHSGLVAILAFLHAVELCGPGLSFSRFQVQHGVCGYIRAIDNILFITRQDIDGNQLVAKLNEVIKPYSVKLECQWGSCPRESAGQTVDFYDFGIVKSPEFVARGILTYVPILRDNGPLLSFASAHQTRLHITWPVGFVKRLHRRASSIVDFRAARDQFVTRLQLSGARKSLLIISLIRLTTTDRIVKP